MTRHLCYSLSVIKGDLGTKTDSLCLATDCRELEHKGAQMGSFLCGSLNTRERCRLDQMRHVLQACSETDKCAPDCAPRFHTAPPKFHIVPQDFRMYPKVGFYMTMPLRLSFTALHKLIFPFTSHRGQTYTYTYAYTVRYSETRFCSAVHAGLELYRVDDVTGWHHHSSQQETFS